MNIYLKNIFDKNLVKVRLFNKENKMNLAEQELKVFAHCLSSYNSLAYFASFTHASYDLNWHHRVICEKLEAVEKGEITRLMIKAPPRCGKTELSTIRFPAWFLGRNPMKKVLTVSYNSTRANEFGGKARNVVNSDKYRSIFGVNKMDEKDIPVLSRDSTSKTHWTLSQGGEHNATSAKGGISGVGGHIIILDDLIKNMDEANSRRYRDWLWEDIWGPEIYTRQEENAAIILVQTPRHKDDLMGRLEKEMQNGGEKWEIIRFPAIAEEDEYY